MIQKSTIKFDDESTIQKSTIQKSTIEFDDDESTIQEESTIQKSTIEFIDESTIQESTIDESTIQDDYNYIQNLPEKGALNYFENEERDEEEETSSEKFYDIITNFEQFSKLKILKNEHNIDITTTTSDSEPKYKVEFDSSSLFPGLRGNKDKLYN